jgi:hypothetical protein
VRSYEGTLSRIANFDGAVMDRGIGEGDEIVEIAEKDAVGQTGDFLKLFSGTVREDASASVGAREFADVADAILQGLDYISREDLKTATEGLALYWTDYLEADTRNRILVIGDGRKSRKLISEMVTQQLPEKLRERVEHQDEQYVDGLAVIAEQNGTPFTDEQYREYINHMKLVVLDDWMATGSQISLVIGNEARFAVRFGQLIGRDLRDELEGIVLKNVEINLCIATYHQIIDGLTAQEGPVVDSHFPVKSYWRKQSEVTIPSYAYDKDGVAYQRPRPVHNLITGAHSSTDDALEKPCAEMVKILKNEYSITSPMPPLTNLVRPYR